MRLLAIILLLTPTTLFCQNKHKATKRIVKTSMVFVAGMADGLNQAISFHYDYVDRKLHLNDKFWYPAISDVNKYKNGDPAQGPKFPGSTNIFVFTTDGYHLTRFVDHLFMSGALTIDVLSIGKKKWFKFIAEGIGYWVVHRIGFSLVYNRFR